jgi:polysaccharide export outer membrane protein
MGKVMRPGEYNITSDTDIIQALALAGGLNTFAAENDILILRREADGTQVSIPFEYATVKNGNEMHTNIVLRSRDIVVVP